MKQLLLFADTKQEQAMVSLLMTHSVMMKATLLPLATMDLNVDNPKDYAKVYKELEELLESSPKFKRIVKRGLELYKLAD